MRRATGVNVFGNRAFTALGLAVVVLGGCSKASDDPVAKVSSPLTVPLPTVSQFAVLASRTASFGDRTAVTGGSVGVAATAAGAPGAISTGIDTRIAVGQVLVSQSITVRDRTVTGEIGSNQINVAPSATTGPRSAFVAPPARPLPGAVTPGAAAVNVAGGQTTTLAAGRFGAVGVDGTLNLSGGLYEFASLRLGVAARVNVAARSTVRVAGGVNAADRSRMTPNAPLRAADLRLIVSGAIDGNNTAIGWGVDGVVTGLVVANGVFRAADRLVARGAISALDVIIGNDSTLTFDSGFPCGNNASCNDNNTCTTDACVDVQCVLTPLANGTTCSDGNACTRTDVCQAGACVGSNPVVCTASDQCHVAGVCDPANGVCSNPNAPNGTTCNDASACTRADSCQAGACVGADPVVCAASDQCHVAGVCNPANGVCSNPNAPNGTTCTDANPCTQTDACQAGACVGANPIVCTASDQCHVAGVCSPVTGACSNPNAPNGTTCTDANPCTQTDACQAGACVGANPIVCTASDQCHVAGVCNPASGTCSNPDAPNGTTCTDANPCTQTDACQAGACVGANPVVCTASDQCHAAGVCNPASGTCSNPNAPNGTTCTDANPCTQTDACQAGACVGTNPIVCTASDQCHVAGTCSPITGACSNPNAPNGTTCSDGSACTQTDSCQGGVCAGGNPVVCTATDQCHVAGVCDPANGACSNPSALNGTTCSDGNACTQTDACQAGACVGGNLVSCGASDQCHDPGTCSPITGACSNPLKQNGSACSDSNACTQTDSCQGGVCVGGPAVTCTASDQCHAIGTCNPATGTCSNPPTENGVECNDGSACTQGDNCQAGACVPRTTVTCMAGDQCHAAGMCDPASGVCSNPAKPDGTTCDNGNICSMGATCQAGTCNGGSQSVVTELPSGVVQPMAIVRGADQNLWFISPETQPGGNDGSVIRLVPGTGVFSRFLVNRMLTDLAWAADGNLWIGERISTPLGVMSALGRMTTAGAFLPDFVGFPAEHVAVTPAGNVWFAGSVGTTNLVEAIPANSTVLVGLAIPTNVTRALTAGPDGNVWIIESNGGVGPAAVGRIVPPSSLREFPVATSGDLNDITSGPDGNLWFTDAGRNEIGRITPAGVITKFPIPTPASIPDGIAAGPDGNLWFTERAANKIAWISPAGAVTELTCGLTPGSGPSSITAGADGNMWFTETAAGNIGSVRLPH